MFEHPTQEELDSGEIVHLTNAAARGSQTIVDVNDLYGVDNVRVGRPRFATPEAAISVPLGAMVGIYVTGEAFAAAQQRQAS